MKRLTFTIGIAVALGGCGNYSNDDVDFQYYLPQREDMAMNAAAVTVPPAPDPAEYYVATRNTVNGFNRIVDAFTGLIDAVRRYPPTQRTETTRVWGPFPSEKNPAWHVRVAMERVPDPSALPVGFRFEYKIEFQHARLRETPWRLFMQGRFFPSGGGARRGRGELTVDLRPSRAVGFPVQEFGELAVLTIKYNRGDYPISVNVEIENVMESATPRATYEYGENADGSGSMAFVWRQRDNIYAQALDIRSRWVASGAGRGEARVLEGLVTIVTDPTGTDCWGPDTRATYVRRGWDATKTVGDVASCIIP